MLTLIENGQVYAPAPQGTQSVLLVDGRIGKIGEVDRRALDGLGVPYEMIDASGCVITPGLIDPHEHLLGGSGEKGFSYQTPEISVTELVRAGITTVVGCLGVDTTMKTMAGLLAKAKGLREEGLNAYIWSGGYKVPPVTVMGSIRDDIMFIEEVIGAGEIAISDHRSVEPEPHELARLISDVHIGGMLSRKAGVTHFHVGEGEQRLRILREVLDGPYEIEPESVYATHVERSTELVDEAIDLARRGCFVDMDTVEEDLERWVAYYLEHGGDPGQLTASSDASLSSPRTLSEQFCSLVTRYRRPLESVLPLVTSNTARALKLEHKGTLAAGKVADLLVMRRDTLELVEVVSRGKRLMREGRIVVRENFLEDSNRRIDLVGDKVVRSGTSAGSPPAEGRAGGGDGAAAASATS